MKRLKVGTRSSSEEKGIALVMVLLILTVVTLLGMTIMSIALNNMKMTTGERMYQSAYYIAESGITFALREIKDEVEEIHEKAGNRDEFYEKTDAFMRTLMDRPPQYEEFAKSYGAEPTAVIEIIQNPSNPREGRIYTIVSRGTIDNKTRTVKKEIPINWKRQSSGLPDTAVFVKDFIKLTGGAQIDGKAGTNSSSTGAIKLDGGAGITGDVFIGPESGDKVIDKPNWMNFENKVTKLSEINPFELPEFPELPRNSIEPQDQIAKLDEYNKYKVINNGNLNVDNYVVKNYTLVMNEELKFDKINVAASCILTIDVGNQNRSITVNSLSMPQGHIYIKGTGKLALYVTEKIEMGGGSTINNLNYGSIPMADHIKKLDIYYKGQTLTLGGAQKIYGSLYADRANLNFTGGSAFQGSVVTGGSEIKLSGGTNAITQTFFAPNAAVINSGGGKIKGSIYAKSYTGEGGTSVNYGKSSNPPAGVDLGGGVEAGNQPVDETKPIIEQ